MLERTPMIIPCSSNGTAKLKTDKSKRWPQSSFRALRDLRLTVHLKRRLVTSLAAGRRAPHCTPPKDATPECFGVGAFFAASKFLGSGGSERANASEHEIGGPMIQDLSILGLGPMTAE